MGVIIHQPPIPIAYSPLCLNNRTHASPLNPHLRTLYRDPAVLDHLPYRNNTTLNRRLRHL